MARLADDGQHLVLRLSRLEKLGAFRRRDLRFPKSAVRELRVTERPWAELRGLRAPGTAFPGVIALGTWRRREGADFAAVYRRRQAIVVELGEEAWPFVRLVVSVDDAQDTKRRLETGTADAGPQGRGPA